MNAPFFTPFLATDPDLGELVELFVQEIPDRISALETQGRSRDWQQLTRTAHQLKGARPGATDSGHHACPPPGLNLP